jgi:glycosyltransferase involved in cell wall biosynthesis
VLCPTMLPVTIWMNMPSFHQDDMFRALAAKLDLRVVYDHTLTADRRRLGWGEVRGGYEFRVLETNQKLQDAIRIARLERDRIHVINGIWAEPAFAAALVVLGCAHTPFAIYAEAPDDRISCSMAKLAVRSAFGRWVGRRAKGMLAVSHFASDYYSGLGFAEKVIYPFGYFHHSPPAPEKEFTSGELEVVFVGQMVHRKGIDILLDAITPLFTEYVNLRLTLIGAGPERVPLEARLHADGRIARVAIEGVYPSEQMHDRLARADVLVLPSRWDGWGLVINEAFSAGIPVIASDRCGGADLILQGVNGYTFRSEDVDDLRACLSAFLSADRKQMRIAALKTASALTIPTVSDYLVACLEHMCGKRFSRPMPPWLEPPNILPGLLATTR